jgi:hypothetical protein
VYSRWYAHTICMRENRQHTRRVGKFLEAQTSLVSLQALDLMLVNLVIHYVVMRKLHLESARKLRHTAQARVQYEVSCRNV